MLRFPSEPRTYRDLRADALEGFRWRCRIPVIRQFGAEAEDLGIFVTACDACGARTARLHPFPELDPDTALDGLITELRTRAQRASYGWRPSHCPACEAPDPTPLAAMFARYLPEIERDLHLEFVCVRGRVSEVHMYTMGLDGRAEQVDLTQGEVAFADAVGAPLGLRALWRGFIAQHVYDDEMVVRRVQPGYVMGLRPFTDLPQVAERMFGAFGPWIEGLQRSGRWDVVTFLRETEEGRVGYEESYRAWLGGYTHEIAEALLEPFVVADSDAFVAVLARQAARYDLGVERVSHDGALQIEFAAGAYRQTLDLAPTLYRIVHSGLTFDRGIVRYFRRALRAMAEAVRLPEIVCEVLAEVRPDHRVMIHQGRFIEVCDGAGRRLGYGDMVRLVTHYDLDDSMSRAELCAELLGHDPSELPN